MLSFLIIMVVTLGQRLIGNFQDTAGIFGAEMPELPVLKAHFPTQAVESTHEIRNIFDFRKVEPPKPANPTPEVKKVEPPKPLPKPLPPPVPKGDFGKLSLLGIYSDHGKKITLWEYDDMIMKVRVGEEFEHFKVLSAASEEVEIEDIKDGAKKKFNLDLE